MSIPSGLPVRTARPAALPVLFAFALAANLPAQSAALSTTPLVNGCAGVLALNGTPGATFAICLDVGPGPVVIPGVGVVHLDLGPGFAVAVDGPALGLTLDAAGLFTLPFTLPAAPSSYVLYLQAVVFEPLGGLTLSNGLTAAVATGGPATFAPNAAALPIDLGLGEGSAAGDLDGDGDQDLVVANSGTLAGPPAAAIYINQGGVQGGQIGSFLDETAIRAGGVAQPTLVVLLGDVDGDGDLDLFMGGDDVGANNRPNYMLVNQGGLQGGVAGFFQPSTTFPAGAYETQSAAFIDANLDGDLDLVLGNGVDYVNAGQPSELYLNDGAGSFTPDVVHFLSALWNVPGETDDVVVADFDGDLFPDLLLVRDQQDILLLNSGFGTFANTLSNWPVALDNSTGGVAADFDLDGDVDVVASNIGGQDKLYVNDGTGVFTLTNMPASPSTTLRLDNACGDFDADGDMDVVVAIHPLAGTEIQFLYENQGGLQGGPAGAFVAVLIAGSPSAVCQGVTVADFDGDGDLDLHFASQGFFGPVAQDLILLNGLCP